jgi:hypothetical protein
MTIDRDRWRRAEAVLAFDDADRLNVWAALTLAPLS